MKLLNYCLLFSLALTSIALKAMVRIDQPLEINLIDEYGQAYAKSYSPGTVNVKEWYPRVQAPYAFEQYLTRFSELIYNNLENLQKRTCEVCVVGLLTGFYEVLRDSYLLAFECGCTDAKLWLASLEAEEVKINKCFIVKVNSTFLKNFWSLQPLLNSLKSKDPIGNKSIALIICSAYVFKIMERASVFYNYLKSAIVKNTLISPLMQIIYQKIMHIHIDSSIGDTMDLMSEKGFLIDNGTTNAQQAPVSKQSIQPVSEPQSMLLLSGVSQVSQELPGKQNAQPSTLPSFPLSQSTVSSNTPVFPQFPSEFRCGGCEYKCFDYLDLHAHKYLHDQKPFRCPGCASSFATLAESRLHYDNNHKPKQNPSASTMAILKAPTNIQKMADELMKNSDFQKRVDQIMQESKNNPERYTKVCALMREQGSPQPALAVSSTVSTKPAQALSPVVVPPVPVAHAAPQAQPSTIERKEQASSSNIQHVSVGKEELTKKEEPQVQQGSVGKEEISLSTQAPPGEKQKRAVEEDEEEGIICHTCYERFNDPREITSLSCSCQGYYHSSCLEDWWVTAKKKNKCPICKKTNLRVITFEKMKNLNKKKRKKK